MLGLSRSSTCLIVSSCLILSTATASGQDHARRPPRCEVDGKLVRVPQLPEGSGIAASQRSPGRFWTHNDSGAPVLFALDPKGVVLGQVRVPGTKVEDWEAVAVGPCPSGSISCPVGQPASCLPGAATGPTCTTPPACKCN